MKSILLTISLFLVVSCAKLPVESLTLTDVITAEGKRMHDLNISLLNKMFKEKSLRIDLFIKNEYIPKYLQNFKSNIPEGTDYEKEWESILKSIVPEINGRRDRMQNTLESQRVKLITKLNTDYLEYDKSIATLRKLIESGIKLNTERKMAFEQLSNLSKGKIDLNKIDTEIDKFIINSGEIGSNINEFNSSINSLIKN